MRRILYIQYTNPATYSPLQHSSRMLGDAGWQVLFLGTGAHGADVLRFPPHPNITVRRMAFCSPGWRQKLHYFRYAMWALFWTLRWRPDWIYASEALVCPIARLLSYLPGVRVIYHEHDSPTPVSSPDYEGVGESPTTSRFQRWILRARRATARRARLCIIPNEVRLRHFALETGVNGSAKCLWNCPSRSEAAVSVDVSCDPGLSVWYQGSIVPSQLPETVIHALALLPVEVTFKFAGYETVGSPGYVDRLLRLARQVGVGDRVQYLGTFRDRATLLEKCSQCHVGLALFPKNCRQPMAGASQKPFEYLARGLALLVSDFAEWRDTYVTPGYARACDPDDRASIATGLRWFLDHPDETRAMGERGRERIRNEWNYERIFDPVATELGSNRPA